MKNKKKAVILAEDLYEDCELWYPDYRLTEAGVVVDGNLVSSRMPADLPAFMRAVLEGV